MGSETHPKLPIIDFSEENLKPGSDSWFSVCHDVRHALEEYGCFMAYYNQVPLELHNKIFNALGELFDLPTEIKVKNTSDKPSHGYIGQIPAYPLHESMGIDHATNLEEIQSFAKLMWPAGNEHFCEVVHSYTSLLAELEQLVMRMVLQSYGIEKYFDSHIASTRYLLRCLKNRIPKMNENDIAFPTHSDKSFMTILQQNHVSGLEVDTKDGKSIGFEPPSPSVFIVIAGDAFMAWSNGRIHPPKHRVIMRANEERYSLALFAFKNGMIKVPEELVDDKHPLQFKPFDHVGFIRFFHTEEGRKSNSAIKAYCGI
ncbi:probable 2-oxoglutarate-dependent dioxygenase AOP1 [Vitis riparia]|uniref:probable 2-oxoglutarate-dependent dioxygenase AOP1 n=1 Tax=Vitis riparia TaxID=96939 RepID=UPI00155AB94D|nr:probable 2-oxoglutarate-dependent dioxygenase AOP1 [Vitis riparia]